MWVAGYCRVSTDGDDQANSLRSQQWYFEEYIKRHPDWQLYRIYADEGITGTSTQKRAQFNRMIRDARQGCFSLIVTKEVSRFSRNILDTISFTRQLKNLGVGVIFLSDGIDTREPDAELRLSIMGTIAQEESRKTSSRVVWGQTRQMEKGVVFGHSMLGYHVSGGKMAIDPEGAELVRLIFHKYGTEKWSTGQIARFLTDRGYITSGGNSHWRPNGIAKILKNEKYVGDLVQKKSYTPDYLTHEKKRNMGQVPLIRVENHHEPIISREIWEVVQRRLGENRRQEGRRGQSNRHVFSGKIRCGVCGGTFVCRYRKRKDGSGFRRWQCATPGCGIGKLVRDDDAMRMLKNALLSLPADLEAVIGDTARIARVSMIAGQKGLRGGREEVEQIKRKQDRLLDCFLEGTIPREEMERMMAKYRRQLELRTPEPFPDIPAEETLRGALRAILTGQQESQAFYREILERLTVFQDRHMELKLKGLPDVFFFA